MKSVIYLFFLVLFSSYAIAQSISVSPNKLEFSVVEDYDSRMLTIYNSDNMEARYSISATDFHDWFDFEKDSFSIKPNSFEKIKVSVRPSAANGFYSSSLSVRKEGLADAGKVSVALGAGVKADIFINRKINSALGSAISFGVVGTGLLSYLFFRKKIA